MWEPRQGDNRNHPPAQNKIHNHWWYDTFSWPLGERKHKSSENLILDAFITSYLPATHDPFVTFKLSKGRSVSLKRRWCWTMCLDFELGFLMVMRVRRRNVNNFWQTQPFHKWATYNLCKYQGCVNIPSCFFHSTGKLSSLHPASKRAHTEHTCVILASTTQSVWSCTKIDIVSDLFRIRLSFLNLTCKLWST